MDPAAKLLLLHVLAGASCMPHERDALLAFKHLLASWRKDGEADCCRWRGVRCSNRNGHVLKLQLGNVHASDLYQLTNTALVGQISHSLLSLDHLVHLDLSMNYLNGSSSSHIPVLELYGELEISQPLRKALYGISKIEECRLLWKFLEDKVSSEWLPPFTLEEAALTDCQIGPLFPAWLRFQVNILWVDISSTGLIGKLPDWFSTTFSKATYLDISHNQINGTLPKNMEFMSLEWLYLSSNELTGEIPFLPKNLSMLDLSLNSLSGNLPSIFRTPKLVSLNLFSNHITGDLSGSICELSLYALDLGNNLFEGELPPCFAARTLGFLLLDNNSFSGKFPLFLQNCSQLLFLDLSRNKFSGKLPYWIGGLVGLRYLRLSQNMFSGNISSSIANLTHLHHLNLANNRFSGVIPWGLSNLTAMTGNYVMDPYVDTEPYWLGYDELVHETGQYFTAVTKGQELYYDIRIFEMVSVDLSFNHLSGAIPEEIAYLDALSNLDLSWNHLSGEVPDKIGVMKSLESLDLSKNMLSGEIPSSISNLSYLSYLDLSDNNLTGRIPSGRQLDTLYTEHPSMYSGNSGLCGPPLKKMCSGNNASKQDVHKRSKHDFETMSFYFGLGFGFMLGLWVVLCTLLFKRAWSIAYFRLIDTVYNQMYVTVFITWKSLEREGSTD
ncbi:unnamed protein product [Urochloa decumbens]|uniref:Leucine-rich repeat-containing N-terminal plant-type domain-containing protein n=1 Tax=Urochloa decumbens TaxID=240449 RepID=A0ABC9AW57_9POAL